MDKQMKVTISGNGWSYYEVCNVNELFNARVKLDGLQKAIYYFRDLEIPGDTWEDYKDSESHYIYAWFEISYLSGTIPFRAEYDKIEHIKVERLWKV